MFAFCKCGFCESPLSSIPVSLISWGQVGAYQGQKGSAYSGGLRSSALNMGDHARSGLSRQEHGFLVHMDHAGGHVGDALMR